MALAGVLMLAAQVVLAPLPNIELVSFFTVLFTLTFQKKVLGVLGVFILLEGLVYGFGLWWGMYLYVWPLLAVLTWAFRWMGRAWQWAILSGFFGLAFGSLCALIYLPAGLPVAVGWAVAGFPFDVTHAIGNACLMLVLYHPVRALLSKLKGMYSF